MPDYLTINNLANRLGINKKTIRYYEEIGLLCPSRAVNGYRIFNAKDERNLIFIKKAQRLGLTLKEIGIIIQDVDSGLCQTSKAHMKELISSKIIDIENRISELTALKSYLTDQLDKLENRKIISSQVKECSCLDEDN